MAWIESHQELRNHPKLSAVCRELATGRPQMIGHLHLLWWWCMDYAMDGDLSKYDPKQIADAAEWDGDTSKFIEVLVTYGLIDRNRGRGLRIHDWMDFCGELIIKRLRRKDEKRRKTAANVRRFPPKSAERSPTVPDPTLPDLTKPTPSGIPRDAFSLIWAKYPRKIGKDTAASKFKAQVRRFTDWLDIQKALDGYLAYIAKEKTEEKFIKHGSTWFNNHWRDWVTYTTEVTNGSNGSTSVSEFAALARANREAEELRKREPVGGKVHAGV